MQTKSFSRFLCVFLILVLASLLVGCNRAATKAEPTEAPVGDEPVGEPVESPLATPELSDTQATGEEPAAATPVVDEPPAEPEPAATEPPPAPETEEPGTPAEQTYTIQVGDTLFAVAQRFGITVEEIAASNEITDVNLIEVGQEIIIPVPGGEEAVTGEQVHIVQAGENLFRIALKYNLSYETVAAYNGIPWPYTIKVGQVIKIPAAP